MQMPKVVNLQAETLNFSIGIYTILNIGYILVLEYFQYPSTMCVENETENAL